ncbi:MAG: bifunctional 5,10-methylene-tetrahydrofolate dehydrogenase/5,10-methylene-tetrahydrofolate cyclohydrolase [Oscillospiraceae bacterium]|nr:bifunctional 5,10-methylene-tetrahydrofolate dehydrogenase/5,10-methylene-tetrahydrofolate cyclohydrolase [Oscillospiraceae bacterium]
MAKILKGAPVAAALNEQTAQQARALAARGVTPTLAIVRLGARSDALSYEQGAVKRCQQVGVAVRHVALPELTPPFAFFAALKALNDDPAVHGILLLRPLPEQIDAQAARCAIAPEKDVDGCTDGSLAGVFTNAALGFPPCTARAALEVLDYYGIDPMGKRAAVVGRSLVVGRPAAMLLLHRGATVTLCHSRTRELPAVLRESELILVCAGQLRLVGAAHLRAGQTVLDAGIHWCEAEGRLCGDVDFAAAERVVDAISPAPGGLGSVTTSVLARHVVEAALRRSEN